ncbi:MAG: thioredoxin family protein [Proteobacteria bacterium]|nr:thioredoxin family protein [Pseudomonadota bacterium]
MPPSISRFLTVCLFALTAVFAARASAADYPAYDQAVFEKAQAADKPILVFVHAPWCPVCKAQMKTIDQVTADPAYKELTILRIDYDTQPELWKQFGATMQSTLIAFHGAKERGRIAHVAEAAAVTDIVRQTLK